MAIPVSQPMYVIKVRNNTLDRIGEIARLTSMTLTPKYNNVGSFEIVMPADDPKAELITPGGWLTFLTEDNEITSGNIRGTKLTWDSSNPGAGMLTVYGPSAEQVLADRLAYQDPLNSALSQGGAEYDVRTGPGESVIKDYVDFNAGSVALSARQAGMVVEPDNVRGSTVTGRARMDNLLELIGGLAQASGLGFRVVFNDTGYLEFRVFVPQDRSGTAKFGTKLGNLVSFEHIMEASKTNASIVGGSGEGVARVFREIWDAPSQIEYNLRSESFVDRRDTSEVAELDAAGTEENTTNGRVNGLSLKTTDTPHLRFYHDYFLGDVVSIPEAGVTNTLREIEIKWTAADGPSTESTIGTTAVSNVRRSISKLEQIGRRIAGLETRK